MICRVSGSPTYYLLNNLKHRATLSMGMLGDKIIIMGLLGGEVGQAWTLGPFLSSFRLLTIRIWSVKVVDGLQFQYKLNGKTHWSPLYGERLTDVAVDISLGEDELTEIILTVGENPLVISSLTFVTGKGSFGPFGQERGTKTDIKLDGSVVGFFGFQENHVHGFGIYVKPN